MDAFPSYSSLVTTVAMLVFWFCYAVTVATLELKSRARIASFSIPNVVVALLVALFGSVLSFLALFFAFGNS